MCFATTETYKPSITKYKDLGYRKHTNGISATWNPVGDVSFASSSRTPREYNTSRALISASGEGDAGQSNPIILSIPKAFNYETKCKIITLNVIKRPNVSMLTKQFKKWNTQIVKPARVRLDSISPFTKLRHQEPSLSQRLTKRM